MMSSFWPIKIAPMYRRRSRGSRRASAVNRDFSADWPLSTPRFSKEKWGSRRRLYNKTATINSTRRSCNNQVRKRRKKSSSGMPKMEVNCRTPQSRRRSHPPQSSKPRRRVTKWRRFWVVFIRILAASPLLENNNSNKRLDSSFLMDLVSTWSPCGSHRRPMSRPRSSSRKASRT